MRWSLRQFLVGKQATGSYSFVSVWAKESDSVLVWFPSFWSLHTTMWFETLHLCTLQTWVFHFLQVTFSHLWSWYTIELLVFVFVLNLADGLSSLSLHFKVDTTLHDSQIHQNISVQAFFQGPGDWTLLPHQLLKPTPAFKGYIWM